MTEEKLSCICEKHKVGDPSCGKCWAALFRWANANNIFVAGTHKELAKKED
jgi:hypothetical protein